ncbi:conserved hypothetical protein (plasmid) [Novosphingobium sp. PP1Y]|nr:conserved hypothetical protein [Novosphingobium sp. PP1Y]
MEMDLTLPDHTVYRPAELPPGVKIPILAWGNGGCANIGNSSEPFLREIASHGYLAVASGPIAQRPPREEAAGRDAPRPVRDANAPRATRAPNSPRPAQSNNASLTAAIDWAIAENSRPGSKYEGRLDTTKIAVLGRSCGGLQAIAIGADPRVKTVIVINSGIIRGGVPQPDGSLEQRQYIPAGVEDLAKLHTPIAYFVGGHTDQAFRGSEADFLIIDKLPLFNGNMDVGHGGTFRQPDGGPMGKAVIDWIDWQLKGDKEAAKSFVGADCRLCRDPKWTVKKKNLR